jgi:hypothetical protein
LLSAFSWASLTPYGTILARGALRSGRARRTRRTQFALRTRSAILAVLHVCQFRRDRIQRIADHLLNVRLELRAECLPLRIPQRNYLIDFFCFLRDDMSQRFGQTIRNQRF